MSTKCPFLHKWCGWAAKHPKVPFGIPIFADTPTVTPKIYKVEPISPGQTAEIDEKY